MDIKQISARLEAIVDEVQALTEAGEAGEVEQELVLSQIEALDVEFSDLQGQLDRAQKVQARVDEIIKSRITPTAESVEPRIGEQPVASVPARVKSQKSKFFNTSEDAYVAGMYMAQLADPSNSRAKEILAAQSIGTDNKGGFTVPTPLADTLVNLLEDYGVARRVCRRIVMSASTWTVPKLTGHATIIYPAEAEAITDSDLTFAQITMTAGKLAALVKMSTEVTEDSVVSMMDTVVQSIAYALSIEEDKNLFNGVAGGINTAGIKTDATVDDTNVASVAALALDDLTAAVAGVGNPVAGAKNEWYINQTLHVGPIRDLLNAAGGNTISEYEGGVRPTLLGYPVNYVNVLPGAAASTAGDLLAVFGDMSMGCYFGDRRSVGFQTLNELFKVNDQIGVIATERIDVKVANPEVLSKITITG